MCGIIGAVSHREVSPILLAGLKHLEYRGYDSAGIAVIDSNQRLCRHRTISKVQKLEELVNAEPSIGGYTGIAHTRWATHGKPSVCNAHPHIAGNEIAIVHNGIIENHESLRADLLAQGCLFESDTDSELVAHAVYRHIKSGQDFLTAVTTTAKELKGAFAIAFIRRSEPGRLIALCNGSPVIIGLGNEENFVASDQMALLSVTNQFIYLEEGDVADIQRNHITIYDANGVTVLRPIQVSHINQETIDKGDYPHFMLKEIFEQTDAVLSTLQGRITDSQVRIEAFGEKAATIFPRIKRVQIVACGTSYHAGLIAKYWLETIAGIPCQVEIASENRYRVAVVEPDTLFVTLSQSGETADTLAAARQAKKSGYAATLSICNVADSSLSREADLILLTFAGPEISVASTKSFTTQLVALFLLTIGLGRYHHIDSKMERDLIKQLKILPEKIAQVLALNATIQNLAKEFVGKNQVLLLGRGMQLPIAMEGALKLKEIAYIHAEAYPAGELKHGSLALVDADMLIIALAPTNDLLDKLKSNLQEILTRNGKLIVFADEKGGMQRMTEMEVIAIPFINNLFAPFIYTIPLQLLAYYIGVQREINVDKPRNLAKSVTVE